MSPTPRERTARWTAWADANQLEDGRRPVAFAHWCGALGAYSDRGEGQCQGCRSEIRDPSREVEYPLYKASLDG